MHKRTHPHTQHFTLMASSFPFQVWLLVWDLLHLLHKSIIKKIPKRIQKTWKISPQAQLFSWSCFAAVCINKILKRQMITCVKVLTLHHRRAVLLFFKFVLLNLVAFIRKNKKQAVTV